MVDSVIREVNSVKAFFGARSKTSDSDCVRTALQSTFTSGIVQLFSACASIDKDDATRLIASLGNLPVGDANLDKIKSCIDSKLLHAPQRAQGASTVKDQQLKCWWNMLTQSDWDFIKDEKRSMNSKMTKMQERGNLIGCTNLSEQTLKWMLAVLLMFHYKDLPSANIIREKLQELKEVVATERKPYPMEQMQVFPDTPDKLPKHVYDYAYTDGPPVEVLVPGIHSIAKKNCLRSNNRLLSVGGSRSKSSAIKGEPLAAKIEPTDDDPSPMKAVHSSNVTIDGAPVQLYNRDDPVEKQLYNSYQADLWKHRAHKQGVLMSPSDTPAARLAGRVDCDNDPSAPVKVEADGLHGSMPLKFEADGSYTISPRLAMPVPAHGEPSSTHAATKKEAGAEDEGDLDCPFALAAIAAFGTRNENKKAAQAATRADKAAKKLADKAADTANVKKPKADTKPELTPAAGAKNKLKAEMKHVKKVKPEKKEPIAEFKEVSSDKILKSMPSQKTLESAAKVDPIHYRGGVVYTVQKERKFRALRIRGDKWSETSKQWGSKRTAKEAWSEAIKAIDAEHSKKKPKKA